MIVAPHSRFKADVRYAQHYHAEIKRLTDVYNIANNEQMRVLDQFGTALNEIKEKLEREAEVSDMEILGPRNGADATIYREVTRNHAAGSTDELFRRSYLCIRLPKGMPSHDRPWFCATLIGGIDLGLKTRNSDVSSVDVHAPVVVAAGYVLQVTINEVGQQEKENTIKVWGEAGEFLLGAPSEASTMDRFTKVMWANLDDALETLLRTYDTMDLTAASPPAPSRA